MTCPNDGTTMVVIQDEPMGKLHQCAVCGKVIPQHFNGMDAANVVHETEGGSNAG